MTKCKTVFFIAAFIFMATSGLYGTAYAEGTVSGTVSYSSAQTGTIFIAAFTSPLSCPSPDPDLYTKTEIPSPGAYTLSGLPDGAYYIASVMFTCGNNCEIKSTDPWGIYGGCETATLVTISGGSALQDIDIHLVDGTETVPNPFYVYHEVYDIEANGVPKFVKQDYTQLEKIYEISRFRSGIGHDYSDGAESCRSMKHYYAPYEAYRTNDIIEIYSPVKGVIESIVNESHGSSEGLKNKQIRIMSNDQHAFIFILFHVDLISTDIAEGRIVEEGELLGHARMYYPDLNEYSHNYDIAVRVYTPAGSRYISYFDTMTDSLFTSYIVRGAQSRDDFIISREERDADPLTCIGESFVDSGNLENWVVLADSMLPLRGDINKDTVVDISDVILVLRIALDLDEDVPCADIDNNDDVDISDVILTLRMALGLDELQPCPGSG
jgi:hypothetical protein